jgi:heat-inducible transcriptional repressor
MVVVITSTGGVIKRVLAFDGPIEPALADWAGDFLNERLTGEGVGSRRALTQLMEEGLSPRERQIIDALAPAVTELEDNEECVIHVGGRSHFLSAQRAGDVATIDALMTTLEERYALLEILRSTLDQNEVYLRVGSDLGGRRLAGISMVAANYGVAHRNLGTVSLFGPSRMDYRLAIPAVRRAASILSEYVDEVYE